jgi:hypothetical protein
LLWGLPLQRLLGLCLPLLRGFWLLMLESLPRTRLQAWWLLTWCEDILPGLPFGQPGLLRGLLALGQHDQHYNDHHSDDPGYKKKYRVH